MVAIPRGEVCGQDKGKHVNRTRKTKSVKSRKPSVRSLRASPHERTLIADELERQRNAIASMSNMVIGGDNCPLCGKDHRKDLRHNHHALLQRND